MARYSSRYSSNYYGFAPYVPVAERRRNAAKEVAKLAKTGKTITPVEITGRKIASSFWGKAWCDHLESYSDYENRLPRGRTYVRNGSVVHLEIRNGGIEALVSGSSLYKITITIAPVAKAKWQALCKQCAGGIGSLVELLQAKLSDSVMTHISHREKGLFPAPGEIKMKCSCPDGAALCKHLAATLYGVGSRLDHQPELLFLLRSVDSADLISQATDASVLKSSSTADGAPELDDNDLSGIFGIEIQASPASVSKSAPARKIPAKKKPTAKSSDKLPAVKKAATKKPAGKAIGKKLPAKKAAAKKTTKKTVTAKAAPKRGK
jgi:uncharacterized Zn finger protein